MLELIGLVVASQLAATALVDRYGHVGAFQKLELCPDVHRLAVCYCLCACASGAAELRRAGLEWLGKAKRPKVLES